MPGNEIPENIHNFFDQDASSQGHQSEVGNGSWPILNNNPWVNIHRQNGTALTFNSKNYAPQFSGSEQGIGLQSAQTPLGPNSLQKADLNRSLSRNQQLNLNGFMHGSQGLQTGSAQADFQGDAMVSDSNNLMQRSSSSFGSQKSNVPRCSSALTKSSDRPEATEAHVNFDFLGGHQMMRNQNTGITQASTIQPQKVNDMQLWQQHLLYKQLKEMQQQQHLMQLQQGVNQQNSLSQLSDVGRQASSNQNPAILCGMPINHPSNNMWSNELVGRDSRLPSSSPMFLSGNTNWAQRSSMQGIHNGLMFPRDQGQAVRDVGFPPQHSDQSFFGTPVASTKSLLNHQSQFQGTQGTPQDFSPVVNQAEDPSTNLSAFNCFQSDQSAVPDQGNLQDGVSLSEQRFQGKSLLQNAIATSGNLQPANHVSPGVQQVGPSSGIANMDATEEKLLFSTEGGNQDTSFGVNTDRSMGGYLHGDLMQSSDCFSSFPTLNSGSWSALMQEAVEASSSDTGLNEEWSGLSFQKTELSSGKHSAMLQDNSRKQQAWHGQNIQNASSLASNPLPLCNDPRASSKFQPTTNFHQSMNFSCQGTDGASADTFHESFQQPCKEAVGRPFDHTHQGKQLDEGITHMQTQFNNISNGVWTEQTPEEPASSTHSSEVEFNPHNTQHSWAHQQKMSLHGNSGSRLDDWNTQSLAPAGGNSSNLYDSEERRQANDTERTMNVETDHDGSMWKATGAGVFTNSIGRREAPGSHSNSVMMHSRDSYTGNLSANSNRPNLNKETSQQGHLSDLRRNAKAVEDMQHRDDLSRDLATPIFSRSTSQFHENKKAGLSSENMLELLHKVDQSKEGKTTECLGFSEQNASTGRPGGHPSDGSFSCLQSNQSPSFQGFGLKLAPPSQRQSASDHGFPSHASLQSVHDFQRNHDSRAREDQSRPFSTTAVQSVPSSDDTAQRENHAAKSFLSGHNKAMYSNFQGNSLAAAAYSVRMNQSLLQQRQQQQQLQWQQQKLQWQQQQKQHRFSSASSPRSNDQSQHDAKQSSHSGKRQESHDVSEPDQSSDASMPSPAASQIYPGNTGPSHPSNVSFHLRSSGQQMPVGETISVGRPVATPCVSQQGGFSTKSPNVWTSISSQQRLSGLQSQKVISNVVPRSPLPNDKGTLQVQQKPGNQNKRKGEGASSKFGTCSTNSQLEAYGEDHSAEDSTSKQMPPPDKVDIDLKTGSVLRGTLMEPEAEHHTDGKPTVPLHQRDPSKAKYVQDLVSDGHKGQVSLPSFAVSGGNSYSLLQQMQSMKGADPDPTGRAAKRLKGAALGMGSSQMGWIAGQRYNYEQNTVSREKGAISQNISSSADVQMLSFSSRDNKENSANAPTQGIDIEVPSQDLLTSRQNDLQNYSHPHGKTPPSSSPGLHISPQMAPLWFERYGNQKIGQTLARFDGLGSFQRNTKASGPNYVSAKVSDRMEHCIVPEQKDTCLVDGLQQSTLSTAVVANHTVHSPGKSPLHVIENNRILTSKKHKAATIDLLPWHKEVTQGCCSLQSISTREQDWARTSNRLIEKLEQEFEMSEDVMARSRSRLILTTQLMQQILPSVPAIYLRADSNASYESVMYLMAKLILGDACSTISCPGSDHRVDSDSGNMIFGKLKISETEGNTQFSRFVETFIERSNNLENDFLRLDKRASLLDVRLECQDLERISIMNRFAKFHGRTQSEGVESSSTSEAVPRRSFPQRHVTAHALPRNLPDGVNFLSL